MVVTLLLGALGALAITLLHSEVEAWLPWVAERLRRLAVRPLQGELRIRFEEEWGAYLNEVPGPVSKVICALGFNIAAHRVVWSGYIQQFYTKVMIGILQMLINLSEITARFNNRLCAENHRIYRSILIVNITMVVWSLLIQKEMLPSVGGGSDDRPEASHNMTRLSRIIRVIADNAERMSVQGELSGIKN